MIFLSFWIFALLIFSAATSSHRGDDRTLEIRMPPYEVKEEDTYLCTAIELPDTPMKLIAVEPKSDQNIAHHMLLFGCQTPAKEVPVWHCRHEPRCKDEDMLIYGWGRNADPVRYPDGVAFSVGKNTNIHVLVLQVHYLNKRPKEDASGVLLHLSQQPSEKTASILMYASMFVIPPGRAKHPVDNECCYSGFEPLTSVAFRVHTHDLGRKVYMTRTAGNVSNASIIAERNPLLPQGFVPVNEAIRILPGDRLKVTCDFDSSNKTDKVVSGFKHNDEMCNMYMITYSEIPHFGDCNNGHGFFFGQGTGIMQENATMETEQSVSDYWRGPNIDLHEFIGESVGVDRGHDGRLWFLHRSDRRMDMKEKRGQLHVKDRSLIYNDTVMVLNAVTGQTEAKWGAEFFSVPHKLTIAPDESVWITDAGKHQVFKFSPRGKLLLALGDAFEPGSGSFQFCAPTAVAVLSNGSVLVSDGYCNKRISHFSSEGVFLSEIKDSDLSLPHDLVADECGDILYVADRENGKVVFYRLSSMERLGDLYLGGYVMALTRGPYQTFLALSWEAGRDSRVYQIEANAHALPTVRASWKIAASPFPHDMVLSAAPIELTGPGDRLFALYIAEVEGERLSKYILVPTSSNHTALNGIRKMDTDEKSPSETSSAKTWVAHLATQQAILANRLHRNSVFHPESVSTRKPQSVRMGLFVFLTTATVICFIFYYMRRGRRK